MNTTTKKIAALLAVIMLLTSCAMLVSCGNGSTENNDTNNTDQALPASEGLAYEVNDDGTCTITGIGTCKDTEIVIPQMIEGHRVSAVAEGAFKNAVVDYAPHADGEGAEPEQNEEQSPLEKIVKVKFPNLAIDIGDEAFYGCGSLAEIDTPNITSLIGKDAFKETAYYNNEENWENGALYLEEYLVAVKENISGTFTVKDGIKNIADRAFYGRTRLEYVIIPESVISIGREAFSGCTALKEVNIPGFAYIYESAFEGCTALKKAHVGIDKEPTKAPQFESDVSISIGQINGGASGGNGNIIYGTNIAGGNFGNVFSGGSFATIYYEGVINPNGTISLVHNATVLRSGVFKNCTALEKITLGKSVTLIGNAAFCGCTALKEIEIPENVTEITGGDTFYGCSSLEKVNLGENITEIGLAEFQGCTSLKNIVIPDSVKKIGQDAFRGCTSLEYVALGSGLERIEMYSFAECKSLKELIFPDSLKYVGERAIFGCSSIEKIVINVGIEEFGDCALNECAYYEYKGTLAQWNAVEKDDKGWMVGIPLENGMIGYFRNSYTLVCTDGTIKDGKIEG